MKRLNQIVFKENDFKISRITDGIGFYVLNFSCDASQIDRHGKQWHHYLNNIFTFLERPWKKRWGGWYVSSATEKKEHVESISLEGGQPSFYAENIPFSSSTIFPSNPTPKLVSCRALPRLKMLSDPGAFRQDLYNHAKMPHPDQSHNMVIYMCADVKHDSWLGGCEFDLPNHPFLSSWSHFTCQTYSCMLWAAACVISPATLPLDLKITKMAVWQRALSSGTSS